MSATKEYAGRTTVTVDRSKAEIEHILKRWGADQFAYGWRETSAMVGFRIDQRQVRLTLPLPAEGTNVRAFEAECRQRWRALALVIKAKLAAIDAGISTIEDEFLTGLLLPDGQSVGEWVRPQVARAYATGVMPPSLPGIPAPSTNARIA